MTQTKRNRRRPACMRTATLATRLVLAAHSGPDKIAFHGLLDGKKLPPGTYTVVLTATAAGLTSVPKSLTFAIVR